MKNDKFLIGTIDTGYGAIYYDENQNALFREYYDTDGDCEYVEQLEYVPRSFEDAVKYVVKHYWWPCYNLELSSDADSILLSIIKAQSQVRK